MPLNGEAIERQGEAEGIEPLLNFWTPKPLNNYELRITNYELPIFLGASEELSLLELCRATTENAAKLN